MNKTFWTMPDGRQSAIYELTDGKITAHISDFGATVHRLYVPDAKGNLEDVVLGFETPAEYIASTTFFGTVVGRSCNRLKDGRFSLNGKTYQLDLNDGNNNLHCGYSFYKDRLWTVEQVTENAITLRLDSPDGDQGFPGNATVKVTYTLENAALKIAYEAVCDCDTVFNLTNHSYFNLAGHTKPEKAMSQTLMLPARFFTPDDAQSIPTGEERPVEGTPFDFRTPKPIGRDINEDYDALKAGLGGDLINFTVWSVIFFGIGFLVSYWMIGKFRYATPGRMGNYTDESQETPSLQAGERKTGDSQAERIIALLGGRENIILVDACMTRLRITVKEESRVADADAWAKEGAFGLVRKDGGVQAIFGPKADVLKSDINDIL